MQNQNLTLNMYGVLLKIENRQKWGPTSGAEIIENHHEKNWDVVYVKTIVPLVSDRDYVVARRWEINDDGSQVIMCAKSIEHEKVPEVKGFVRCNIVIQAAIFNKVKEDETHITLLSCIEPNGWIPNFVVSQLQNIIPNRLLIDLTQKGCYVIKEILDKEEENKKEALKNLNVRAYLDQTVVPLLMQGMTELVKVRPDKPVEWLAGWLLENDPNRTEKS